MGPILLLPPEFLAQQQGGFGASAGPFMPMHLMGGGYPGQPLRPAQAFGQPQQPPAPRTREVRGLLCSLLLLNLCERSGCKVSFVKAGCPPLLCWPWSGCSVILKTLRGPSACSSGPSVCLQTCHEGEDPGEVVIRLRKQDILKVHTSHMVLHKPPEICFSQALHDDHAHHVLVESYLMSASLQVSRLGEVTMDTGGTKTVSALKIFPLHAQLIICCIFSAT